jgi:hypothetical protein
MAPRLELVRRQLSEAFPGLGPQLAYLLVTRRSRLKWRRCCTVRTASSYLFAANWGSRDSPSAPLPCLGLTARLEGANHRCGSVPLG